MNVTPTPLEHYVALLRAHVPFAFARYGDGEWTAILGLRPKEKNCDGHLYYPALREDLAQVLESRPSYMLGMQGLALRTCNGIDEWLAKRANGLVWHEADVFHRASIRGGTEWNALTGAISAREVVLVGPARLSPLALFPVARHIVVPAVNCYLSLDDIEAEVLACLPEHIDPVLAVSAGMPANLLIDRLHRRIPKLTMVDFGSLWEPYVGVSIRSYHASIISREAATGGGTRERE